MPFYRRFYASASEAQAGVAAALDRIKVAYTAKVVATGQAAASAAPTSKARILAIQDMPAGAVRGVVPYSRVTWEFTSPDGRSICRTTSILPTSEVSPSTGGTALITATSPKPTLTVKGSVATNVWVTGGYGGLTLQNGVRDPATNKRYTVAVIFSMSGDTASCSLVEDDPTDKHEVTLGTPMQFTDPGLSFLSARVQTIGGATVPNATPLVDPATGKTYATSGSTTIAGGSGLIGDITATASFLGQVPGPDAVPVGTMLQFTTPPAGVAKAAVVASSPTLVVPAGLRLQDPLGRIFSVSAPIVIGDALQAPAAFIPPSGTASVHSAVGTMLTVLSPPTGVSSSATVTAAPTVQALPQDFTPQVFGAELQWGSYVRAEPGGQWSANVFTLPIGT